MVKMSVDSDRIGSDEEYDSECEEMMSTDHKRLLQRRRHSLCSTMTPDEVITHLHQRRLLTRLEVDMINSKDTRQSRSEQLLDILERRPDRAFGEFVVALKNTYQPHLARLLKSKPRDLKNRELPEQHDANKDTQQANLSNDTANECTVRYRASLRQQSLDVLGSDGSPLRKIDDEDNEALNKSLRHMEAEILEVAKVAIANLKKHSSTPETLCKQMNKTSKALRNLRKSYSELRTLFEEDRNITKLEFGSIIFSFHCPTKQSMETLEILCKCGQFAALLEKSFLTEELCSKFGVRKDSIRFHVAKYPDRHIFSNAQKAPAGMENRIEQSNISQIKSYTSDKTMNSLYSSTDSCSENLSFSGSNLPSKEKYKDCSPYFNLIDAPSRSPLSPSRLNLLSSRTTHTASPQVEPLKKRKLTFCTDSTLTDEEQSRCMDERAHRDSFGNHKRKLYCSRLRSDDPPRSKRRRAITRL